MAKVAVKLKVSKPTAECISPNAPKEMRLMAASGKLPVEPKELIVALYFLANDKDVEVKEEAKKSILEFPLQILKPVLLSDETPPTILDFISRIHSKNNSVLELIIQNKITSIKTVERLAEGADNELLEGLAKDSALIKEKPTIFEAIKKNSSVTAKLIGKIGSVLKSEEKIEADEEELPEELIKEKEEGAGEEEEQEEGSLYSQILNMGVSQKIKLAITGNKEARGLLVKEANRLVCGNVMKNPRITESEVILISASKSVSEEVFRIISKNKEWMKKYQVKLNLASNPRAPMPMAMSLLNHLRVKDLELLSKSRNISKSVANMARRTLSARKKK